MVNLRTISGKLRDDAVCDYNGINWSSIILLFYKQGAHVHTTTPIISAVWHRYTLGAVGKSVIIDLRYTIRHLLVLTQVLKFLSIYSDLRVLYFNFSRHYYTLSQKYLYLDKSQVFARCWHKTSVKELDYYLVNLKRLSVVYLVCDRGQKIVLKELQKYNIPVITFVNPTFEKNQPVAYPLLADSNYFTVMFLTSFIFHTSRFYN